MSYAAVQVPDANSLLSGIKDIIISATEDLTVEILVGAESILQELYQPDTDGNISIYELDRVIGNYLQGAEFDVASHPDLIKVVTVKVNTVTLCTFNVLNLKAYTNVAASSFFDGKVFLHLMKQVKRITPTSKEYLSCIFTNSVQTVKVFVTKSDFSNSAEVTLFTAGGNGAKTFDVSFPIIAALFPAIPSDSIIAYRVKLEKEISVFMIDRQPYLLPLEFRFRNSFDVPETIVTRGTASRKGNTTFDTTTVRRVEQKYNVVRNDQFEVSSGKIYSLNDYDRYAEMFNSEVVELNFMDKWRKISIDEENTNVPLRTGSLPPVSFTFRFADKRDNNIITGESFMRWILEYGKWTDGNMWIDPEHWLDS